MPAAAKMMADNNLAAGSVAGTGRDGRVTKGDVLGALAGGATPSAAPAAPVAAPRAAPQPLPQVAPPVGAPDLGDRPEQRVPMSAPARAHRRAPAAVAVDQRDPDHVQRSEHGAGDGDAQALPGEVREGARRQDRLHVLLREGRGAALKKYPVINASVDGNDIVYHGYFDIGIAVGSPRGLVVPILRNADQMCFADIEKKIAEFGQKARDGKLGARRPDRRHVLDLQRRRVRLDAVDADHQPAAVGDPRRARDQGPRGGRERPGRGAADELPRHVATTTASSTAAKPCWAWWR